MNTERVTWRAQLLGMLFASPYLLGLLILTLFPIGLSLYLSFTDYPMLDRPMWIGLSNYIAIFHDPIFYKVLQNTIYYALGSVPLTLGVSILLAVLLNQAIPGRAIFRTIIFLPSLVPAVASAMLWLCVLQGKAGLLNVIIRRLFDIITWGNYIPELPDYLKMEPHILKIFMLISLFSIGNTVVIFLAGLQDIPTELYESASLDGASPLQRLRHITLPMLSPVIFFNMVMGIIGSWQVFTLPQLMIGEGANRAAYFYSMYIFNSSFTQQRMGYACALAWIQFLIVIILTGLVILTSKRWVHYR